MIYQETPVHGLAIHNDTPHVTPWQKEVHVMLTHMAPLAGVGQESVAEINTFYVTSHFSGWAEFSSRAPAQHVNCSSFHPALSSPLRDRAAYLLDEPQSLHECGDAHQTG